MSNYLILAILVLTVAPIVFGVLLGLLRGSRRALLRLILIILSAVAAFVLCGMVTNAVVEVDISQYNGASEPMTIVDMLTQTLGEDLADLGDIIVPIAQSLIKVIMFLFLFGLFWFVTWLIVYPICKLFVKPKKVTDSEGRTRKKKHRLLGSAFGLVQGIVVALCVCIVFNGFFSIAGELVEISEGINEVSQSMSEGEPAALAEDGSSDDLLSDLDLKALFEEYQGSALGQLYGKIGSKPFALLTQIKTDDGKTITLSGQIEALHGIVDIAKEFVKITELDFDNLYTDGNIKTLTDILNNIQATKDNLSEEANGTVEKILDVLGNSFGVDIKKFYSLNFSNEAEAFNKLSQYKDTDFSALTPDEMMAAAKDIVNAVGKSELLLEVLADQDIDIGYGLDEAQIDEINSALDEMVANDELDAETVDKLREIFGLNYQQGEN
ncbi:MAG: hypothetical protein J1F66_02070 [Clostridiales bacterium]|nr:hypothetical protein [Clostridiales bacterium]